MYFVKNVYHHGLIEMHHVPFVDVNYQLEKQIFVMDLLQDILFGINSFFFNKFKIINSGLNILWKTFHFSF
jgi:hypothetical protein